MRVVPVEGEAVGEPGVDVVQAHLLPGRVGQGLESVDHLIQVSVDCNGQLSGESCACER